MEKHTQTKNKTRRKVLYFMMYINDKNEVSTDEKYIKAF